MILKKKSASVERDGEPKLSLEGRYILPQVYVQVCMGKTQGTGEDLYRKIIWTH